MFGLTKNAMPAIWLQNTELTTCWALLQSASTSFPALAAVATIMWKPLPLAGLPPPSWNVGRRLDEPITLQPFEQVTDGRDMPLSVAPCAHAAGVQFARQRPQAGVSLAL